MGDADGELEAAAIGPAHVNLFGTEVPVLPLTLGILGLVLARMIAPPPLRKLTCVQQVALTALLAILLFLIVTGAFTDFPLEAGMAVVWGIGLGFSGMLSIEFVSERAIAGLRAMLGGSAMPMDNVPSEPMARLKNLAEQLPEHRSPDP